MGGKAFEVIYFAFEFYGFRTCHLLINPASPLVRAVLQRMLEDEDYFFFALSADGRATAFRSEVGQDVLFYVRKYFSRVPRRTTTEIEYDLAFLDLSTDRFELTPASP